MSIFRSVRAKSGNAILVCQSQVEACRSCLLQPSHSMFFLTARALKIKTWHSCPLEPSQGLSFLSVRAKSRHVILLCWNQVKTCHFCLLEPSQDMSFLSVRTNSRHVILTCSRQSQHVSLVYQNQVKACHSCLLEPSQDMSFLSVEPGQDIRQCSCLLETESTCHSFLLGKSQHVILHSCLLETESTRQYCLIHMLDQDRVDMPFSSQRRVSMSFLSVESQHVVLACQRQTYSLSFLFIRDGVIQLTRVSRRHPVITFSFVGVRA